MNDFVLCYNRLHGYSVSAGSTDCRADIVFVLGMSGNYNFNLAKSLLYQLVGSLNIGDEYSRVGVVTYSTTVKTTIYLKTYYSAASLQRAISSLPYSGSQYVNTAGSLAYVRTTMLSTSTGARYNVPKVVVVLTAGTSTDITYTKVSITAHTFGYLYWRSILSGYF